MGQKDFAAYAAQYRRALLEDVIPFWMKHSPDRTYGGYFHSLDRDGSVIDRDKYMWLQNREAWTFSMLYNRLEPRPEWLDMAAQGIAFLKRHGRDAQGDWYFALREDGRPTVQPYNIFSDCFAVIAFSEYAKASGDEECLDIAARTYDRIQARLPNPKGKYNKVVTENRRWKSLSLPMMGIYISSVMNAVRPDPKYDDIIDGFVHEVMTQFLDREHRVIHENITPEGGFVDSYDGRHINPGHGIESMWFIMDTAHRRGDRQLVEDACQVVKWCLEFGWDREYGGLYYFMDKFGKPHIELSWDMKLWWPHLEALVALVMGYKLTGDEELWRWFERVHEYAWSRFPDPEYGEWFGYLNRHGVVNNQCKGNRWKGCFHLPRALFLISGMLQELSQKA